MAGKSGTTRKSKLDKYLKVVGSRPDREVAEIAGVTPENVRTYRMRRRIPAAWRGETEQDLDAKLTKRSTGGKAKKPAPKRRARGVRSRPSRLDPFKHLLGDVPDKEIAEKAGVSAENVRSYRIRRHIPARWRGEQPPAAASPAAPAAPAAPEPKRRAAPATKKKKQKRAAPAAPLAGAAPAVAAPRAPRKSSKVTSRVERWAYRVVADDNGVEREYVALGRDMAEAAVAARTQLSVLHPGARLREIVVVGEAL